MYDIITYGSVAGPSLKGGAQDILDGLFAATQAAGERMDAKGDELKDRLSNRLDTAKGNVQSAIAGAGSVLSTTADIVADTTKLVANFLTEDLANTDIKGSLTEAGSGLRETVSTLNGLVMKFATILHTTAPSLPSWDTIKNPKQWPTSLMKYAGEVSQAFSDLAIEATEVYQGISAKYCTPAEVIPSVKEPGMFVGPAFKLVLSSGKCELDHLGNGKQLTCTTPNIEFKKEAAKYVAKHHTPIEFKSKDCKVEKELGEEKEIVLFEITGGMDYSKMLQQASDKIKDSFDIINGANDKIPGNLKGFLDEISGETELAESVSKYDEGSIEGAISMIDGVVSYTNGAGNSFRAVNVPTIGGWTVQYS